MTSGTNRLGVEHWIIATGLAVILTATAGAGHTNGDIPVIPAIAGYANPERLDLAFGNGVDRPHSGPSEMHAEHVLVRFAAAASIQQVAAAHQKAQAISLKRYRIVPGLELVRVPRGAVSTAIAAYAKETQVLYAEPDYVRFAHAEPNDARFGQLWGLHNTGQTINGNDTGQDDVDMNAPAVWDRWIGDPGFRIAVIDTGINYNHPDLAPNIWTNPGEIPGNGIDDEGNGYVDDIHGYDFFNDDGDPDDDNDHGSHCAGTIGAAGNNAIGVVGVNWHCQLIGLKFLNAQGSGLTSGAIAAMQYVLANGIRVTSNSWGGGAFSQALMDAIDETRVFGHLFVASAGNWAVDNDVEPNYPSNINLPNILAVAAINNNGQLAFFSNYGATTVDLGAPGVNVLSTIGGAGYAYFGGTSMAVPHVSGAIALLWSARPGLKAPEVKAAILEHVQPLQALQGRTASGGMLQAVLTPHGCHTGRAFYTQPAAGAIHKSMPDGSQFSTVFSGQRPMGIALDPIARKIYWGDQTVGRIRRANLDGSQLEDLISVAGAVPAGLALDLTNGRIYWCDLNRDSIERCDLNGAHHVTLITGLHDPWNIALNVNGNGMYWTSRGGDGIRWATLDGTGMVTVISGADFLGIGIDSASELMYYSTPTAIHRAKLQGGGSTILVSPASGLCAGLAIDTLAGKLHWVDPGNGSIMRSGLDGSNIELIRNEVDLHGIALLCGNDAANVPPVADAGGPYSVEHDGPRGAVALNGTLSADPDNGPYLLSHSWSCDCPNAVFDPSPLVRRPLLLLDGLSECDGVCLATLTVSDGHSTAQHTVPIHLNEATPPVIALAGEGVEVACDYDVTIEAAGGLVEGVDDVFLQCDDCNALLEFPFPVVFYDRPYLTANVSSNGNLQFISNYEGSSNACLPDANLNTAILAHWDDLALDGPGEGIFTRTTGVAPNRAFHIEWRAHLVADGQPMHFELRLHENSRRIEVFYDQTPQLGGSATIGVQKGSEVDSTQLSCNAAGAIGPGMKVTFDCVVVVPIVLECPAVFVEPGGSATDNCDGDTSENLSVSGQVGATPGLYVLHYNVTDASGNPALERRRHVMVVDTTAPDITTTGISDCYMTLSLAEAAALAATQAIDACAATVNLSSQSSGSEHVAIVVTAGDGNGNDATATFHTTIGQSPPEFAACPLPEIVVPAVQNGDCSTPVILEPPSVMDACNGTLVPVAARSDGRPLNDPYPTGVTTITWTATDIRGVQATCAQRVEVQPTVSQVVVSVELEGIFNSTFTRCVRFELFDCDLSLPAGVVMANLEFVNGTAIAQSIPIPCGHYTCITAADPKHTLRRTAQNFAHVDGQYTATFSSVDGQSLLGGNLNDDRYIDILDYGVWAGRYLTQVAPGTPCQPPLSRHADINGNGEVFLDDFAFIAINFFRVSDPTCCGLPGVGDDPDSGEPLMSVTVAELLARGMPDLAAGDVNGDGVLDQSDLVAVMMGAAPALPAPVDAQPPRDDDAAQDR